MHLLIVMTAERGLCGGFNSNIATLARADAHKLLREGKTVKILCVGRKGYDNLRRDLGKQILADRVDLKGIKQLAFANADEMRRRCSACSRVASSTSRRSIFSRVQVGDRADADGAAAHPGEAAGGRGQRDGRPARQSVYEYEPDEEDDPRCAAAAQHLDADLPRACSKMLRPSRARG